MLISYIFIYIYLFDGILFLYYISYNTIPAIELSVWNAW